jgi:hypothetical protein
MDSLFVPTYLFDTSTQGCLSVILIESETGGTRERQETYLCLVRVVLFWSLIFIAAVLAGCARAVIGRLDMGERGVDHGRDMLLIRTQSHGLQDVILSCRWECIGCARRHCRS